MDNMELAKRLRALHPADLDTVIGALPGASVYVSANAPAKKVAELLAWSDTFRHEEDLVRALERGESLAGGASLDAEIEAYGKKAASRHAHLPVAGFARQLKVPIDLRDIYVPLRAMPDLTGGTAEDFADATDAERRLAACERHDEVELRDAFTLAGRLGRRGTLLLGDPGSGKTTHLLLLLLACLREGPASLGLPEGLVPVYLPLRNLRDLGRGLDAFIEGELASPHLNTAAGFGRRLLARGRVLFLLDGLDEVADEAQRAAVAGWIAEAARAHDDCRFVVTCRYAGYDRRSVLGELFLELHIRPLSAPQAEAFVRNWYRLVERGLSTDPAQQQTAREDARPPFRRCGSPFLHLNVER